MIVEYVGKYIGTCLLIAYRYRIFGLVERPVDSCFLQPNKLTLQTDFNILLCQCLLILFLNVFRMPM